MRRPPERATIETGPGNHTAKTLAGVAVACREEYQRRWNATTPLYPGIAELLDELTRHCMAYTSPVEETLWVEVRAA